MEKKSHIEKPSVHSPRPTYSTNPLQVNVIEFGSTGPDSNLARSGTTYFDQYADRPVDLEDLQIRTTHSVGRTIVESGLLNQGDNQELIIASMGWGDNFYTDISRLGIAELANQNPDSDILILNNPGSGKSSALPRATTKEMQRTGSFSPYGEILSDAINLYTQNYENVRLYGYSMGARAVIAAAPYMEAPIDYLAVADPPGSRQLGSRALIADFMVNESAHAARYAEHSNNLLSIRLQQEHDKMSNTMRNLARSGIRGMAQMIGNQVATMSKQGLREDLEKLADAGNTRALQIASPEFSRINNPEDMSGIMQELAQAHPQLALHQAVLLGQTHSVNLGGNSHTTGALSKLW